MARKKIYLKKKLNQILIFDYFVEQEAELEKL